MDGNNLGVTQRDLTDAVRESAMLADVTISVWGAERTDNKALDDIKAAAGATGNVGRVIKNMLAGVDGKLKDVKSAFGAVRAVHYGITLPWVSDPHALRQTGPRLLPHLLFDRYLGEISQAKRRAGALLDEFILEYPDLVVKARANLGGLADAHYPSAEDVRANFRVAFDFEPIPAGNHFGNLPPHMLERLSRGLQNKQARMVEAAQASMWTEAKERVKRLVDRLSDPEAKFKATTVENLRELLVLMPGWNVSEDPRVVEIVEDLSAMLDGATAEKLREDAGMRASVSQQGQAVADKLAQWGL